LNEQLGRKFSKKIELPVQADEFYLQVHKCLHHIASFKKMKKYDKRGGIGEWPPWPYPAVFSNCSPCRPPPLGCYEFFSHFNRTSSSSLLLSFRLYSHPSFRHISQSNIPFFIFPTRHSLHGSLWPEIYHTLFSLVCMRGGSRFCFFGLKCWFW